MLKIKLFGSYFFGILLLAFSYGNVIGQSLNSLKGTVRDESGNLLSGVTVLLNPTNKSTQSNTEGVFSFNNLHAGRYELELRYLGYTLVRQEVQIPLNNEKILEITLKTTSQELQTVHIDTQSENDRVRQQVIKALVVDTRAAAEQPTTLAELMNRTTGIKIRQSGGLGTPVDVSINGFQGNAVQYFKDGIPLDYLGGGYALNSVPINLLERVEVYKGVIPIALGGDALGGAVHLVSKKQERSTVNASYEIGSFNTHVAQLSAFHTKPGANWFIGMESFYNDAANDYKADVQIVNEFANQENVRVRLFHNGYQHGFGEVYAGLKDLSWTDELRLSFAGFGLERESQHPALMTNPYGAVTVFNRGWIPSIRYRKSLFKDHLKIDQFITQSTISRGRTDTISGTFDWFGDFTPSNTIGESPRKSLSEINFKTTISRTHIYYRVHPQHHLEANATLHLSSRMGEDPYGMRFTGTDIDVLSKKASYHKMVGGISWESNWLNDRLTNTASVKYFYYQSKGINGFMANAAELNDFTEQSQHHWGVSNALKFQLSPFSFVRASLELTNRLPRENELFGDADTRAPNFDLTPERSFNAQLGYTYQHPRWRAELGSFYRMTQGMILLVPVQPPFAQYQNLDSVQGFGLEAEARYRLLPTLQVIANATWQDNRMVDISSSLHHWMEGTRLRNTPYFFANAGMQGQFQGVLHTGDRLQPYLNWNYIREFYLNHIPRDKEPGGFLGLFGSAGVPVTNIVPDQHLVSLGATYHLANTPLAVSGEVKNIFDANLYDYYKIQRPGQSFHLKLTYSFNP